CLLRTLHLFPYTTLFRSKLWEISDLLRGGKRQARDRTKNGWPVASLPMRNGDFGPIAFSPNGETLAVQRNDAVQLWQISGDPPRSEEHTSELQSPCNLVC